MSDQTVKLKVTAEKFDENFSIDDWFNFDKLNNIEMYNIMLKFVVDAEGNPVSIEEARKQFKEIKKAEWLDYLKQFTIAIRDAFVSPTSGDS